MWARIENGTVGELTDIDPDGRYHKSLIWVACPDNVVLGWLFSDGEFSAPKPPDPEETRRVQAAVIRARSSAALVAIAAPYTTEERETWKTQEEEARMWTADPDAPCPMVRAMATARGIGMELMVAKILKNAGLFRTASGQILGQQQAELDSLYPEKREEV